MMTQYTIRFYRSEEWSARFKRAGINKPAGMVLSHITYPRRIDALRVAAHINSFHPEFDCEVIEC
jgi:hypothetical protein